MRLVNQGIIVATLLGFFLAGCGKSTPATDVPEKGKNNAPTATAKPDSQKKPVFKLPTADIDTYTVDTKFKEDKDLFKSTYTLPKQDADRAIAITNKVCDLKVDTSGMDVRYSWMMTEHFGIPVSVYELFEPAPKEQKKTCNKLYYEEGLLRKWTRVKDGKEEAKSCKEVYYNGKGLPAVVYEPASNKCVILEYDKDGKLTRTLGTTKVTKKLTKISGVFLIDPSDGYEKVVKYELYRPSRKESPDLYKVSYKYTYDKDHNTSYYDSKSKTPTKPKNLRTSVNIGQRFAFPEKSGMKAVIPVD